MFPRGDPTPSLSGQSRIFQSQTVKLLCLYGIHLIEGEGRYLEGQGISGIRVIFFLHVPYVDRILNGALTPELWIMVPMITLVFSALILTDTLVIP